ncbi:MAG: NAD-dependent succinate-semialdehyde dehydrogenase [Marinosulfonomonas sp.]|nr:NAD-dependent succinate-semialdehyde dehydrogenase [Marinosulfonomonas sp.]
MKDSLENIKHSQCLIGGKWVGDGDKAVTNPATGAELTRVPVFGTDETNQAIACAKKALPGWSAKLAKERSNILRRWFDLVNENTEELAQLLTAEQGKPLAEARGEISYAASFIEFYAEEAKRLNGETIPSHTKDSRILVIRQPIGVVAAITPWNFPAAMITRKLAPALAAGCTTVLKPATETPLTAFAFAALAEEAGLPPGCLNVISGKSGEIGAAMCAHPDVRALTFTGSTPVGKLLIKQSADTVKRLGLELGGNAPFIVFDDADLDAAVDGAMMSKFRNAGQTCVCANRIYVQDGVYDAFAEKFAQKVAALQVGNGTLEGIEQGPLINQDAVAKVEEHIADAVTKGANVKLGGNRHSAGGNFFEPTLLTGVTQDMAVAKEETFGPLAPLFPFSTEEEAIAMANDTEFGLAAYFYARDIGRVWRVGEALEYGMVAINSGILSTEVAPFGGIKESGQGREGSAHGMDEFTELKYMLMAGI